MSDSVTSPRELADELVAVVCDEDPTVPTLYGLDGDHDRLADLSEAAEQGFRAKYADIAAPATALDTTTLNDEDATTLAVVNQQAQTRIDNIDARLIEYTITDIFIAPAAQLLMSLPMT